MATAAVLPRPLPTILAAYAAYALAAPLVIATGVTSGASEEWLILMGLTLVPILISQAGFLSFWAVWAPQPPRTRIILSLAATMVLYLEFVVTLLMTLYGSINDAEALLAMLFVPLAFFSAQVPQWILKFAIGSQLVCLGKSSTVEAGARRFTLAELFGATGAVAVALASARLVLSLDPAGGSDGEMVIITLSMFGAGAGAGLLLCVPCTWAILIARDLVLGIAALAAYGGLACLVWFGVLVTSVGIKDVIAHFGVTLLFAIGVIGGPLLCLSVSLGALRSAGYRIGKVETTATPDQDARCVPPRPGLAPGGGGAEHF